MIIAAVIAVIIGLVQFFLDTVLFASVFAFKATKGVLALLIKIVVYGAAFFVLFKLFRALVKAAAIGFAIGFFPCVFIYCVKKIRNGQ